MEKDVVIHIAFPYPGVYFYNISFPLHIEMVDTELMITEIFDNFFYRNLNFPWWPKYMFHPSFYQRICIEVKRTKSWWRHQMETFSALLAICARNSPVTGEFPAQRPVRRSFDVFFYLSPNKRLSKQPWGWWFRTPSCPLWRHNNVNQNVRRDIAKPHRTWSILIHSGTSGF